MIVLLAIAWCLSAVTVGLLMEGRRRGPITPTDLYCARVDAQLDAAARRRHPSRGRR